MGSCKVRKGVKYCWNCNADQSISGPPQPGDSVESGMTDSSAMSTSFGKPQNTFREKRKAMSLESFTKAKASQQQSGCTFRSKKKSKSDEAEKEVVINIGLKQLCEEEIKIIRGKRLPLSVPQSATYKLILEKAVKKWKAFDRRFDASKGYVLLFDDDTDAQFMPGKPWLLACIS